MVRVLLLAGCLAQAGCSLILDFSDSAIPIDATPDTPGNQAECAFGEPNDTIDAAVDFVVGDGPAAICTNGSDDHDFYKLAVPAGTTSMTIQISFTNFASGDLDLYLYDTTNTQIAVSPGTVDNEKITCPGAAPNCPLVSPIPEGTYVFEVRGAVAGTQNRYDIAITLAQ